MQYSCQEKTYVSLKDPLVPGGWVALGVTGTLTLEEGHMLQFWAARQHKHCCTKFISG